MQHQRVQHAACFCLPLTHWVAPRLFHLLCAADPEGEKEAAEKFREYFKPYDVMQAADDA